MEALAAILFWLIFAIGCLCSAAAICLIAWVRAHLHVPSEDPYSNPWGDQ